MNAASVLSLSPLLTKSRSFHLKHLLPSLLHECSSFLDLKSVHAAIIKNNFHNDSFIINQFLAACGRRRQSRHAFLSFAQMAEPNIFVYNAMIGCFINCSETANALHMFVEIPKRGLRPTCHTFSHLIKACTRIPSFGFGEAIHGHVRKNGLASHQLILQTGLIDFYSAAGRTADSRKVFDEMIIRDAFSCNTMIFGYARSGNLNAAWELFEKMPVRNAVSWNTLIAGCARSGDVDSATSLFRQMPTKNLVSWTSMISCFSQNGRFVEALETFDAMNAAGMKPDEVTMATVISACAHLGALETGRRMHRLVALNSFLIDVHMGSALIDMYAKCGNIERALLIFLNLEDRNLFCWNSIIDGLAMHGRPEDVFYVLSKMIESGEAPNGVTFISVLSACNHAGLVEEGRKMFSRMAKDHLIAPEMGHYNCMVDLLARSGLLHEALDLMQRPTISSNSVMWGALLNGCKIHGDMGVGQIAMERLRALNPSKSSSYLLLVDMYARENRWEEVAALRGEMKEMRIEKKSFGCSCIEMNGIIHQFAASDASHASHKEIYALLFEIFDHMKLEKFNADHL